MKPQRTLWQRLQYDLAAILDRDPAARSKWEVFFCYPSVHAVLWHRLAHWLYGHRFYLLARLVSQWVRFFTGIEIHPGADIGDGLFIDHGMGVVIGETADIGDDVTIYQSVTLGGTGKDTGKRHPTIGDRVMIGSGARVLGPFRVGADSKIGAGAVVLKEVPPGCTVVGNPGRVVRGPEGTPPDCTDMDQVRLPDPVADEMTLLRQRVRELESQLEDCRARNDCSERNNG